jgi:hypothetical protein
MNLKRSYKIIFAAWFAAQSFLAGAQTNSADAPVDYSSFSKFIADRNIFDPNRVPHEPNTPVHVVHAPVRVPDSFSLVGVIGYGEGRLAGVYAFFDGSSLEYRKSAQVNDSIAAFKIAAIGPNSVTLTAGTNQTVLRIGEQLRDDGAGHWVSANGPTASYNNASRRNSGRGGFTNGNRRRRNYSGNSNRDGNNSASSQNASNNSQTPGQNLTVPNDSPAPDNMVPPEDNIAPDPNAPDNMAAPEIETPPAPPADTNELQNR